MGAGVSAAQEAERSRRAAAEHRRRADAAEQRAAAFEAGERGELIAAAAWRAALPPGCHVWDDVRWPGRPIANIDGVVVGPFGLIVWDAKHWSGRVTVSNGTLRQGGYRRDEKLLGAQQAVAAVLQAARLPPIGLPVLCLTGAARVPQPTVVAGVTVLSVDQLATWLTARPRIVSPEAMSGMAQALSRALTTAAPTPRSDNRPASSVAAARPTARSRGPVPSPAHRSGRRPARQAGPGVARLALVAVLAVAALTGLLGRVVTPAASWFGHHEAKMIVKQVPAQPHPQATP